MKLQPRAGAAFCAKPPPEVCGALLYGPDASLVLLRKQSLVAAISEGDDLRIDRLDAGELRRDPAAIITALKSRGFFPGRRAVVVEAAGDGLVEILAAAVDELTTEDGFLIVTAGTLAARSKLRKLFETNARLAAIGFYADPPNRAEIEELLRTKGLEGQLAPDAVGELVELGAGIDRGQLSQLIEKIHVYQNGRDSILDATRLRHLGPGAVEAEIDALADAIADGEVARISSLVSRLSASGVSAVQMLLMTVRRFRQMLTLNTAPEGMDQALRRLRPPVFGPRAERLTRQCRGWDAARTETALRLLYRADRTLRSPGAKPDAAMTERVLIRIAMLAGRR